MAYFQRKQYGMKETSKPCTVPDNDVARLMYYFHCVCSAIEYDDDDVAEYRDYKNWSSLTYNEIRVLLVLCLTLSPDVLDDKVFFHSDALCGDRGNKMYEINEVSHQLLAVSSVVIAGRTCRVKKIMTYKMSWMSRNYYEPVQRISAYYNRNTLQTSACVIS